MYERAQGAPSEFGTPIPLVFCILLLLAISQQHTGLEGIASNLFIFTVYFIFFCWWLYTRDTSIQAKQKYVLLFLILFIFVTIGVLSSPTTESVIRLFVLAVFTGANLFIIPRLIPLEQFLTACSRFAASLVLLGFLPYLGVSNLGPIDLSLWGGEIYWYSELNPITSVYVNPNALGFLLLVASISALVEWRTYDTPYSKYILFINILGLLFTNYRTGWVALVLVLCLYVIYSFFGRKWLVVSIISAITATAVGFLMMFSLIPGPTVLKETSLNGRRPRWSATFEAIRQQPFFGYGLGNVSSVVPNPHNSYIRMYGALGIGGGTVYLLFFISALVGSARQAITYQSASVAFLLTAFFFIQLLNQLSFIGTSIHSTLIAITLGYHITECVDGSIFNID